MLIQLDWNMEEKNFAQVMFSLFEPSVTGNRP
jgi:hypothetical protein